MKPIKIVEHHLGFVGTTETQITRESNQHCGNFSESSIETAKGYLLWIWYVAPNKFSAVPYDV